MYNIQLGALGLLIGVSVFLTYLIAAHQHRLKLLDKGITIYYEEDIRKPFKSISITYYLVYPHWLFQAFMYMECLCIGLIGQNWYYSIVIAFFTLMTINPSVKVKRIFVFHMIGAIGALIMAVLGVWLYYGLFKLFLIFVGIIGLSAFLLCKRSNITYIVEVISIAVIVIGMTIGTLHQLL